jgi:DNA invertase Pin-like site-specific DNA recombinase
MYAVGKHRGTRIMAKTAKAKANETQLRAAGYARTSGEGQRDNTSIPNQRQRIKELCTREGWQFVQLYVDESKSGSKIVGREAFQEMLRDAAAGKFDVVVVNDIDRLGRDGTDIVSTAKTLKQAFGIDTVDTKGKYDTRDRHRRFTNWIMAGVADDERLRIMERTIGGRMRRAAEGKPWSGNPPIGRDWDEVKQCWYVTDRGKQIAAILKRYVAGGAGTTELAKALGVGASKIGTWIRHGQLGGEYKVRFHSPDLELDKEVPVPGMPEVVSAKLVEKAKALLDFNRTYNRTDVQRYLLTGFLRCGACGKSLTGYDPHRARRKYCHTKPTRGRDCVVTSVPGEEVEAAILDYLYRVFLDAPAFNKAVEAAAPSTRDRKALDKERSDLDKQLAAVEVQITRLADAVAGGMELSLLLGKQQELVAERDRLAEGLAALEARLASLPDPEMTKRAAMVTRLRLRQEHEGRDWRKLAFDEVRQFLHHLFGEPTLATKTGMFVTKDDEGKITITFKGLVDFDALMRGGRPFSKAFQTALDRWNEYVDQRAQKGNERPTRGQKQGSVTGPNSDHESRAYLSAAARLIRPTTKGSPCRCSNGRNGNASRSNAPRMRRPRLSS